jgi:hypothetical protein
MKALVPVGQDVGNIGAAGYPKLAQDAANVLFGGIGDLAQSFTPNVQKRTGLTPTPINVPPIVQAAMSQMMGGRLAQGGIEHYNRGVQHGQFPHMAGEGATALAGLFPFGMEEEAPRLVERGGEGLMKAYEHVIEDVPIEWAQSLIPHNRLRTSESEVNQLAADIKANGLHEPLMIAVGKNSRTAVLGEGNHRLEALKRLGYTHVPMRTMVGDKWGSHLPSNTRIENDLIPVAGEYFKADAKPSDVFKSLKEYMSTTPEQRRAARAALPRQQGFRGTQGKREGYRDPLENPAYKTIDQYAATHFAATPPIAKKFAKGPQGHLQEVEMPGHEQFIDIPQQTLPGQRAPGGIGQKPHEGLMYDQTDMDVALSTEGFKRHPTMLAKYLKSGGHAETEMEAYEMASKLAKGWRVWTRNGPMDLEHLVRSYAMRPSNREDKKTLARLAGQAMREHGYKGFSYINTAPQEIAHATDPRDWLSYGLLDPNEDVRSLINPTQMKGPIGQ